MSRQTSTEEYSVVVVSMKNNEEEIKDINRTVVLDSEQDERQGKDELNIVELPFALVSNRNSKEIKTIKKQWIAQDKTGKSKQCFQTITGSDDRGLPTFQAEMVAIAAMELTFKNQLDEPVVNTTQYEMCRLLSWPYTSQYRKLLRDMFAVLAGLTIETNHFYDSETGEHKWAVFGIIDNAEFGSGKGHFKWNDVLFKSFKQGNIKSLDTHIYFSLKRNLAKRLFRYADRHIYNGQKHEVDLKRLCYDKLLMLGKYQGAKHLIRKIQPAIDEVNELEKDGVKLFDITITKSKTTASKLKVVFCRPRKTAQRVPKDKKGYTEQGSDENSSETQKLPPEAPSEGNQALIDRLIAYELPERLAQGFVKDKPEVTARQVEVLEYLLAQPDHGIKNPGGRLRRMIEEEWFEPEGFISKAEQEKERQRKQEAEQKLLESFRQDVAQAEQDLERLMQLSLKGQVAGQLKSWKQFITEYQLGREPSPQRVAKKEAELIEQLHLQSREERFKVTRTEVQQKYMKQAAEQGIGFNPESEEGLS